MVSELIVNILFLFDFLNVRVDDDFFLKMKILQKIIVLGDDDEFYFNVKINLGEGLGFMVIFDRIEIGIFLLKNSDILRDLWDEVVFVNFLSSMIILF